MEWGKDNSVSPNLQREFQENGSIWLSEHAVVWVDKKRDRADKARRWNIRDGDQEYVVEKENDRLMVKIRKRIEYSEDEAETATGMSIDQFPSEVHTADELLGADEYSDAVRECLTSLSQNKREVLLLSDAEGFNLAAIAASLNIYYGTAASRLHYAREEMKKCLKNKGYRFVSQGVQLPPVGTTILQVYAPQAGEEGEILVHFDIAVLQQNGYRFVPQTSALPPNAKVVMKFQDDRLVYRGETN